MWVACRWRTTWLVAIVIHGRRRGLWRPIQHDVALILEYEVVLGVSKLLYLVQSRQVELLYLHPSIVGQHRIVVEHAARHCLFRGHLHRFHLLPIWRIFDDIVDRQALDSSGRLCGLPFMRPCLWQHHASQAQKLQPNLHHLGVTGHEYISSSAITISFAVSLRA